MRTSNNVSLHGILTDIVAYVDHLADEGVTEIEVSPGSREVPRSTDTPLPPTHAETIPTPDPQMLPEIAATIATCTQCPLHESRTNTVPGQGSSSPEIMFIGEAPGYDEDQQGLAFVGAAGQLLTRMIQAMGLTRNEVFIGNILKCRPPDNRTPLPDEMETCLPYLKAQVDILKPKVIITLGAVAAKGLLDIQTGITKLRGHWLSFEGIDVMPTFHPAYILHQRSEEAKKHAKKCVWADLKAALGLLGREPPPVKKNRST